MRVNVENMCALTVRPQKSVRVNSAATKYDPPVRGLMHLQSFNGGMKMEQLHPHWPWVVGFFVVFTVLSGFAVHTLSSALAAGVSE